jgi:hypothetical protein
VATLSPDINSEIGLDDAIAGEVGRMRSSRSPEAKSKPVCVAGQAIGGNAGSMQPTIIQSELLFGTFGNLDGPK